MDPHPVRPPSFLDPQLLWAMAALIATLLLGAIIFAWLDRWRKRGDRTILTPADQLTSFRQSYDRGELSQAEYERIRAKLAPKLREQVKLPPKPATASPNPGPDGQTGSVPPTPPIEPTTE
ncbi:MAG TPA: SHOCT domain-containing protein [Gemmataceae bacterium]|nr:SHOCT domain-containing protein [Gemmataceae bacterium]